MVDAVDAVEVADSADAARPELIPYRAEILRASRKYHLPAALLAGVIQQESVWNEWAERTEPNYLKNAKIKREAAAWSKTHGGLPSALTETADRARSMGLMQPMGEVAREQGFDSTYLSTLFLPANSIDQGAKLLRSLLNKYKTDTLAAIAAYNAGTARRRHGAFSNARYVFRVLAGWDAWREFFKSNIYGTNFRRHEKTVQMGIGNSRCLRNSGITAPAGMQYAAFAGKENRGDTARYGASARGFDFYPRYDTAGAVAPASAGQLAWEPKLGLARYIADSNSVSARYDARNAAGAIYLIAGFLALVFGYSYLDWRFKRRGPGHDRDMPRYA